MKWGLDLKRVFVTVELPITTAAGDRRVISQAFTPSYFARSTDCARRISASISSVAARALSSMWRIAEARCAVSSMSSAMLQNTATGSTMEEASSQ